MSSSSTYSHSTRKPTPRQLRFLRVLAEQTGTTFTSPESIGEATRLIETMKDRKRTPRAEIRRERLEVSRDMATHRGDGAQVTSEELVGYGSTATWAQPAAEASPGARVVHCKREPYDVYVGRGRGSRWGNPFKTGRDGTHEEVIAKYERWLLTKPQLIAALPELRGKVLGCWCAPKPCHADVLLRLANAPQTPATTPATPGKGKPHAHLGYRVGDEQRLIFIQRIRGAIRVGDLPADGKGARYLVADSLETCGELDALLQDYTSQAGKLGVVPASPAGVCRTLERAA